MSTEVIYAVGLLAVLALLVLVVTACAQIIRRYTSQPPVMVLWLVVVILAPILGVAAWFLWDGWIRRDAFDRARASV